MPDSFASKLGRRRWNEVSTTTR